MPRVPKENAYEHSNTLWFVPDEEKTKVDRKTLASQLWGAIELKSLERSSPKQNNKQTGRKHKNRVKLAEISFIVHIKSRKIVFCSPTPMKKI